MNVFRERLDFSKAPISKAVITPLAALSRLPKDTFRLKASISVFMINRVFSASPLTLKSPKAGGQRKTKTKRNSEEQQKVTFDKIIRTLLQHAPLDR